MDFNSLKKASNLFNTKWVPKVCDIKTLLEESSDSYILKNISSPETRKEIKEILSVSFFKRLYKLELHLEIPVLRKELESYLSKKGVELLNLESTRDSITFNINPSNWFADLIKPKFWLQCESVKITGRERLLIANYGFNNTFLEFITRSAVKFYKDSDFKFIERTESGGRIEINLEKYLREFDEKNYIEKLEASVFDIISFFAIRHFPGGVILTSHQNWNEIINSIQRRLHELKNKKLAKTSTWLIHRSN